MKPIIQLIINGEEADFFQFMEQVVERALSKQKATTLPLVSTDFQINPNMAYKITDKRIHQLFGAENKLHPEMSIIRELRKYGISPLTVPKSGSTVLGSQLIDYFKAIKKVQEDYKHKN